MDIIKMDKTQLLSLLPESVQKFLSIEEFIWIAQTLGAFWKYDYEAAKKGRVGKHAVLKSGLHSDCFFVSRILLEPNNICRIMANQMAMTMKAKFLKKNHIQLVAGIPDGATKLGEMVANILGVPHLKMEKVDGKIKLIDEIPPDKNLLLAEDFCTQGTGFKETVGLIYKSQSEAKIIPFDPVLLNRGGLAGFPVAGKVAYVYVSSVVDYRVNDWALEECPLCKMGSIAIKPKVSDESWIDITTSQL